MHFWLAKSITGAKHGQRDHAWQAYHPRVLGEAGRHRRPRHAPRAKANEHRVESQVERGAEQRRAQRRRRVACAAEGALQREEGEGGGRARRARQQVRATWSGLGLGLGIGLGLGYGYG